MVHDWAPFRRNLPRVVFGHASVRSRACLALSRADGYCRLATSARGTTLAGRVR
jgi:hypothetical protein